jgi:phage terminase small subunit
METEKKYTKKELKKLLTEKQIIFCHQIIIDWNATRSYQFAYPDSSYNAARSSSADLLTNPNILQYIDLIKDDIEKESGITKLRNLKELAKIAYSTIAHLHNTWIELKEFESLTDDQKSSIESIETKVLKKNVVINGKPETINIEFIKIKLYSKVPSIAEISKMLGHYEPEKHEHEIDDKRISKVTVNRPDGS